MTELRSELTEERAQHATTRAEVYRLRAMLAANGIT